MKKKLSYKRTETMPSGLTGRQEEIKDLRSQGLTQKAIADKLGISTSAVQDALRTIKKKREKIAHESKPVGALREFERIRDLMLRDLKRRVRTEADRKTLSIEEVATIVKMCRENIQTELEGAEHTDRPIELVHNFTFDERGESEDSASSPIPPSGVPTLPGPDLPESGDLGEKTPSIAPGEQVGPLELAQEIGMMVKSIEVPRMHKHRWDPQWIDRNHQVYHCHGCAETKRVLMNEVGEGFSPKIERRR